MTTPSRSRIRDNVEDLKLLAITDPSRCVCWARVLHMRTRTRVRNPRSRDMKSGEAFHHKEVRHVDGPCLYDQKWTRSRKMSKRFSVLSELMKRSTSRETWVQFYPRTMATRQTVTNESDGNWLERADMARD